MTEYERVECFVKTCFIVQEIDEEYEVLGYSPGPLLGHHDIGQLDKQARGEVQLGGGLDWPEYGKSQITDSLLYMRKAYIDVFLEIISYNCFTRLYMLGRKSGDLFPVNFSMRL